MTVFTMTQNGQKNDFNQTKLTSHTPNTYEEVPFIKLRLFESMAEI